MSHLARKSSGFALDILGSVGTVLHLAHDRDDRVLVNSLYQLQRFAEVRGSAAFLWREHDAALYHSRGSCV